MDRGRASWLLWLGGAFVFMAFMRYSLPELGWVAFAPFLVYLNASGTPRRHLAVLGVLAVAFLATASKMATSEIPWAPPVPMFALPLAVSYFAAIALASAAHRRLGPRWGVYTFAAMTAALGWAQVTFTPGSSWGALAHTQLDNLPLVQLASLTGIGGITFLVALATAIAAAAWSCGPRAVRAEMLVLALLLGSGLVYGQLRLGRPAPGPLVRVGAVVGPVTHREFHAAYSGIDETLRGLDDGLFARSARAVDLGARVVVWNEIATLVTTASESAFVARGQAFARERGVTLCMAYARVTSMRPFHDVNQYRLYRPDGTLADEYIKRHPVPGDPDEKGKAHAKVVTVDGVRLSGAICYDYGFPEMARANAADGAGLALVPSSDWRGIDPEHGRMALMNAVAAGVSMVRPVRAATTIACDPYGRLLGTLRADAGGDGVMVVDVPAGGVRTLYTRLGDVVPVVALAFCVFVAIHLLLARRDPPAA